MTDRYTDIDGMEPTPQEIVATAIHKLPCLALLMPMVGVPQKRHDLVRVYAPHWYGMGATVAWTLRTRAEQFRDNAASSNTLLARLKATK